MNSLVSIIVPVYKVEKYLNKCITRIVNQTYTNLQIILVDDGSPDHCPQICDQWSAKDKRIEVIHKKNGGLSDARNAGLRIAKGEFIAFVDSDDYISINMIEKMLTAMVNYQADMVICEFINITPNGFSNRRMPPENKIQIFNVRECLKKLLEDRQITNHVWRKLYKRELLPVDPFPVGMNFEDIYVMADFVMACNKIVSLDDAFYYYLKNDEGIIKTKSIKNCKDFSNAVNYMYSRILKFHPEMKETVHSVKKKNYRKALIMYMSTFKICHYLLRPVVMFFRKIRKIENIMILTNKFLKDLQTKSSPRFFILATPGYGNLGDRALTLGEDYFIKTYFPEYTIVHIPLGLLNKYMLWKLKQIITENDKLALHAGGNFGSLYPDIHYRQEKAIEMLKDFPIVVFPQTFFYSTDIEGQKMLSKTKLVYQSCSNLTITTRDQTSYAFLKENFPEIKSLLIPDMVLNIPEFTSNAKRNGALICLRNDAEATLSDEEYNRILQIARDHFASLEETDTHVYYNLSDKEAEKELDRLWRKMASSEIVITDRLHGMLFSALTRTPCICVMSKSHKIKGCYEWIKHLNYVMLVENLDELESSINNVISVKHPVYDVTEVRKLYQKLSEAFSSK